MECKHLRLVSLSLEEMEQIQEENQTFLAKSVLSDVIRIAVERKIERMKEAPIEVHPWLNYWLVQEKSSGQGVGLIGSKFLPDEEGYVEIGYAMAKEYRNRGYMTEALEGFLDWLYDCPFCTGAFVAIRSANIPSVKVAENCGFTWEKRADLYEIYRYEFERENE